MRYVAYYRVSTQKQGKSGLGLETQKAMVDSFAKKKDKIVAEYTEIESGRRVTRVELAKGIERAKREDATLLIAKLDRLARNVGFIFALRNSGARLICCDIPEANTLTIGIFAYRKSSLTYAAITEKLNDSGYQTRHGKQFYGMTALRMIKMFA